MVDIFGASASRCRRPRGRARGEQLHQARLPARPPRDRHAGQLLGRRAGHEAPRRRPRVLLRTHTSNVQIREMTRHAPPMAFIAPGRRLPPRRRRHALADVSPNRGFLVDEHVSDGGPQGRARRVRRALLRRGDARCASGRATSRSSSRAPRSTSAASSASGPTARAPAAASASTPAGSRCSGCGMIHPGRLRELRDRPREVDRLRVRDGRSNAWRCSATACRTSGCSSRTIRAFSSSSEARVSHAPCLCLCRVARRAPPRIPRGSARSRSGHRPARLGRRLRRRCSRNDGGRGRRRARRGRRSTGRHTARRRTPERGRSPTPT